MVVIVRLALEKYVHLIMHISQNLDEIVGRNYLKSLVWIYFENSQKKTIQNRAVFKGGVGKSSVKGLKMEME